MPDMADTSSSTANPMCFTTKTKAEDIRKAAGLTDEKGWKLFQRITYDRLVELVEKSNDIARWAHLSDEQQEVEIKQMNEEMVRQGQPAVSEEVWHWRMAQNLLGLSRYEQKKRESQAQLGLAGPSLDTTVNPVKIDLAHTKPEDVREAAGLTTEGWKAFLSITLKQIKEVVGSSDKLTSWEDIGAEQKARELQKLNKEMERQGQPTVSEEVLNWRMGRDMLKHSKRT